MEEAELPVFTGATEDYQGDEQVPHRWSDGRIDLLPAWPPGWEDPMDRLGHLPCVAGASAYSVAGTFSMGGAGLIGSTLLRLTDDVFVEVPRDESYEDLNGPLAATAIRGSMGEVLRAWVERLPQPECSHVDWIEAILASHDGVTARQEDKPFTEIVPDEMAGDLEVEAWVDTSSAPAEIAELIGQWRKTHPCSEAVTSAQQPEANELRRSIE